MLISKHYGKKLATLLSLVLLSLFTATDSQASLGMGYGVTYWSNSGPSLHDGQGLGTTSLSDFYKSHLFPQFPMSGTLLATSFSFRGLLPPVHWNAAGSDGFGFTANAVTATPTAFSYGYQMQYLTHGFLAGNIGPSNGSIIGPHMGMLNTVSLATPTGFPVADLDASDLLSVRTDQIWTELYSTDAWSFSYTSWFSQASLLDASDLNDDIVSAGAAVPIPGAAFLFLPGLALLGWARRKTA